MATSYLNVFPSIERQSLSGIVYVSRKVIILDTAMDKSFVPLQINRNGSINLQRIDDARTLVMPDGRLRVALVQCDQGRHVLQSESFKFPLRHQTASPYCAFPLLEKTLEGLVDIMQLPAATGSRIVCTPVNYLSHHFQIYRPRGVHRQRLGITMKLPDSSVVVGTTMALSLSHCYETNVTEALVLYSCESYLQKITHLILSMKPLIAQPAALPVMMAGLYADVLNRRIEDTWQETFELETASGQSGIILASDGTVVTTGNPIQAAGRTEDVEMNSVNYNGAGSQTNGKKGDRAKQLELIERSIGWAQLALGWQNYTQVLSDLLGHITQFIEDDESQPLLSSRSAAVSLVQEEQRFALLEQVDFLSQRAAGLVIQAQYLRGRLELQNTAVRPIFTSPIPGYLSSKSLLTSIGDKTR
ncbi:hypothetical protein B0H66DRAFT_628903 [Apodospora peruviana]|uniref:Uncharacterized protein n=1 Tax=Apodospora peruviana TaxID=516989 RepID=A0AAE0M1I2_9PEZI|nr:hypothetical protein B0H66DRAFT_628903 [Apodospora peruviana]